MKETIFPRYGRFRSISKWPQISGGRTVLFYTVVTKRIKRNLDILYHWTVTKDLEVDLTRCIFLTHIDNRQNLGIEAGNDEIDELYPSVTAELQDYSPELGRLESTGYYSHVAAVRDGCDSDAAVDLYFFFLMKIDEYSWECSFISRWSLFQKYLRIL